MGAVDPGAIGGSDHDGDAPPPIRPVADPSRLGHDLVEGGVDVVGKLDFGQHLKADGRHPNSAADDRRLGDRSVEAAVTTESLGEFRGGLEDPTLFTGDVLAEHDGVGMRLHDLVKGPVDRGDQIDLLPLRHGLNFGRCLLRLNHTGVDPAGRVVGVWRRLSLLNRKRQLIDDVLVELTLLFLGEQPVLDQVLPHKGHRIALLPMLNLIAASVESVVVV